MRHTVVVTSGKSLLNRVYVGSCPTGRTDIALQMTLSKIVLYIFIESRNAS